MQLFKLTQQNRSSGTNCVVIRLKDKVMSRVNVDYQIASFQNTVCNFVEKWNAYNVICKLENDNIDYDFKILMTN